MEETEETDMQYTIIRSGRRSLALELRQGELLVRAPFFVPKAEIDAFVRQHRGWIEKQTVKAEARRQEEESVVPLSRQEYQALADEASRRFAERAAYYAPLIGVTYSRITIRCQRTKWGSCSGKGNLNFNALLMLAPPEVLDSVVVHELCHRKVMNHSKVFYAEVLRVYPDYWKWHAWLRENGRRLMLRAPRSNA